MRLFQTLALTLVVGASAAVTRADVTPHPIFSDNMVLQQGTFIVVWGKADAEEKVSVTLNRDGGDEGSATPVSLPRTPRGIGRHSSLGRDTSPRLATSSR